MIGDWKEVVPPADGDWGYLAHQAAIKHLDACDRAQACQEGDCEEHADPDVESCESPAIGPYCSCQTCIVRETLAAAWPIIEASAHSGEFA